MLIVPCSAVVGGEIGIVFLREEGGGHSQNSK
jgi:hypothetical protein